MTNWKEMSQLILNSVDKSHANNRHGAVNTGYVTYVV